jgi:hypothetical protein
MAIKLLLGSKAAPVTFSYAAFFDPRPTPDGNDEKYSVQIVLDKDENAEDIEKVQKAVEQVASDKFGPKAAAGLKTGKLKNPLRDADEEGRSDEDPFYRNKMFINASSKRKPQVVDASRDFIYDADDAYSGCSGRVSIALFPFDVNANKGVGAGLNNAQVLFKGKRLDGAASAEDEFDVEELD